MRHAPLVILGSGPAGATAAIYAGRSALNPLLIRGATPGGQLTLTTGVENYPGFNPQVSGPELVQTMEAQAIHCGAEVLDDHIERVDLSLRPFQLQGVGGDVHSADALIVATGATAKWLGLESEKKFQGFGVSACATCDGFFFKDQPVVVVGGGNTAAEEALYLTGLCAKVYLVHRRDSLRAEPVMAERVLRHPKIEILWDSEVVGFAGSEKPLKLERVLVKSFKSGQTHWLEVSGCFIAIGHKPNTEFLNGQLKLNKEGYITLMQAGRTFTSVDGVFAAGDVSDSHYRQAVTAAGSGCKAAMDAYLYLQNLKI